MLSLENEDYEHYSEFMDITVIPICFLQMYLREPMRAYIRIERYEEKGCFRNKLKC